MKKFVVFLFVLLSVCLLQTQFGRAQSAEFTYQGSLQTGAAQANGNFDFEFLLFDALAGGAQIGATVSLNNVAVANGVFAVQLNFGNQFPGANRFLEIRVRPSGQGGITILSPRQMITSAPYSVKSLTAENAANATNATNAINATTAVNASTANTANTATTANNALQLGGVAANQYVLTGDTRLSDARNPLPNSSNYIQNGTTIQGSSNFNISGNGTIGGNLNVSGTLTANLPAGDDSYIQNGTTQQSSSNFNVSGNGTVGGTFSGNLINAATQYNINGSRVLSTSGTNLFAGVNVGLANTTGTNNSFFGSFAGQSNTTGNENSFFGHQSGTLNTTGNGNSFFGNAAGQSNTTGNGNSFFGDFAGRFNSVGINNSFFGASAGQSNTTGGENSFFGRSAGQSNTTGSENSFFGRSAGSSNTTGGENSFFGFGVGFFNTTGSENSFFGFQSGSSNTTGTSNSFFGYLSGDSNTTGDDNAFFGTFAGSQNTTGINNSFFGGNAGTLNTTGIGNAFFGKQTGLTNTTGSLNTLIGTSANVTVNNLTNATAIGSFAAVSQSNSLVLGSINGINSATADTNVGIGTTAPARRLHILGAGNQELMIESSDVGGIKWTIQSSSGAAGGRFEIVDRTAVANRFTILANGFVGIGTTAPNDRLDVNGTIGVASLGAAGSTQLCRNASNQISSCSSSIRYKSNIKAFSPGLDLIRRLRPVSFNWKADNLLDLGLVAEEVAEITPLLTTVNEKGETEGVKYDRVGVVLVNAVNEQQVQIEAQARQLDEQKQIIQKQQSEIDQLKALVCSQNQTAPICQPKK